MRRLESNDGIPGPGRRPGFTLVELLVVIGVVAVLVGVLLPALANARQNAFMVASMNNMRQLNAAALAYTFENDEKWPVVPVSEPPPGATSGNVSFSSWQYGGKTSSDYWKTSAGGIAYETVDDRPLNPYIYPDLLLEDPINGRLELEVYRCPSDKRTFQRGYWRGEAPEPVSSYDDVGTSYHMNMNWWYKSARPGENLLKRWRRTEPVFRRGGLGGPSKFVWLYDQIMDVVAIYGSPEEGDHGGLNRAKAAFMDGHVEYLRVEPEASNTTGYWLLLE